MQKIHTAGQNKYIDYRIIQGLLPRVGKRSLETLVDQMYHVSYATLNANEQVHYLMRLHEDGLLLREIEELGLSDIYQLESDLIPILAQMEDRGIAIDSPRLQDIGERIRSDIERLEREIYSLIGEPININSPKQLQGLFFDRLGIKPTKKNKTGYSVDTDVLEEIAKTHDVARLILEYRGLSKLASTYIDGLTRAIDAEDKRIHTTYDSLGAATGRMSSNDPNLQNIPTGDGYATEIKSCFVASPGHSLVVADYSQIELRILAFLSQDDALLDTFEQGEDIHTRTAKFLFEKNADTNIPYKPNSEQRRIAKTVNFGVIYGITGYGLAKTLGVPPWEAQQYVDAFYAKYPGVRKYYDDLLERARETGYVETYFGRRRYIPSINDANRTMRQIAEREAMNMPIQGTAADILKLAMREIDREIQARGFSGKMLLQVHDELVFEVPDDEVAKFRDMVEECMESILIPGRYPSTYDLPRVPPIKAEVGVGKNWVEAK